MALTEQTQASLSGWGNFPRLRDARVLRARGEAEMRAAIAQERSLIARGNGRSYGDPAMGSRATLSLLPSDRLMAFDADSGVLTCEAGVMLADILDVFVPRGWFVPVTPGTKFVTVGGAIASNVHGKNHHGAGSFGNHVESLTLALADGRVVRCSPQENADLFAATCGGMGLTGVIVSASFRLMRIETAYIRQETHHAANLETVMAMFEANQAWTYSVAWIDCLARGPDLGRSLLYLGEHARADELPAGNGQPLVLPPKATRRVPIDFPAFALNRWSVRAFNALYYRRAQAGGSLIDYDSYFYPLDAILEWNRIYGRPGFLQFQCVLPKATAAAGLRLLLDRVARSGRASFLAVLKLLGKQDGLLSFPMEGYTLALDFPADTGTLGLMLELDAITADHGGRPYLAKDSRCGATLVRQGYPHLGEFQSIRARVDPTGKFSSLQSERLGL
ncbi:MAG: FAD-binding oxidoreductase [Azospirillaceae bacterium]|nr:FAD-binding oxidoreductase [Azospirillaceae bacterium]